jgi:hypothetical protein
VVDYVPDEQSGYFYDENASAHQSEDAYEEFIEEAKLLLAGVTPINPEACQPLTANGKSSEYRTRQKSGRHSLVHFILKTKMEMPPTFCRVRHFSAFLYGNGNIATV